MPDVADIRAHWRAFGPPAHIGIAVLAAGWGNKLTEERDAPDLSEVKIVGPSIADMAKMAAPIGGDTMGASLRILQQMERGG